jgi:aspartyl-tRNA(Asn)/glutamyl-tRNA(Gln) amidotransferase subunit A
VKRGHKWPKEFFDAALNSDMAATIETAINEYKKMGAEVVEVSMPNLKLAIPAYYVIAPAECSANLSRMGIVIAFR